MKASASARLPSPFTAVAVLVGVAAVAIWLGRTSDAGERSEARTPEEPPSAAGTTSTTSSFFSRETDGGPVLDRARADRIRDILRATTLVGGAQGEEVPTTAAPEHREMPTSGPGDRRVSSDYVRDVVRDDYIPLAKQCYEATLAKNAKLSGRIEMSFTVVGDEKVGGVVDSAEFDDETSTIIDASFRTCLRESMLSVTFDAPPGGRLSVKYPIDFSPDDEAKK